MPVERRLLKLPIEHPEIKRALEAEIRMAAEGARKGYYFSGDAIRRDYGKEKSQLVHTLKTGEVTTAAVGALYRKYGVPARNKDLGRNMDRTLSAHKLPPVVAAQVKAALLQHELRTKQLSGPQEKIFKAGPNPREEHTDRRGVRLKQLLRAELEKSLREMKRQPPAP